MGKKGVEGKGKEGKRNREMGRKRREDFER